jgi:hypothetical protein
MAMLYDFERDPGQQMFQVFYAHQYASWVQIADSDESGRRFRLKPATCSDASQPVIPTKPAGGGGADRERW